MKKAKRLWLPLLLGVLLMATLVGVASARPGARPREQSWMVLAIPAAAFAPATDGFEWHIGDDVVCDSIGANCSFAAEVNFPAAGQQAVGAVHVKRVTLYSDRWRGSGCSVTLYRTYPPTGSDQEMAYVHNTFGYGMNASMDATIQNNPVYRVHAPWLSLTVYGYDPYAMPPSYALALGVFIHYTW